MMMWRLFSNGDIKVEMMSLPWNIFLRSLLCFVVVRSSHDEELRRISFRSVYGRHKKEKFLNSACSYRDIARRLLGIYS
jgi:hypothetical protein